MVEIYLEDGVYAIYDNGMVWLDCRAQPHLSTGPTGIPGIALEPATLARLVEFWNEQIRQQEIGTPTPPPD